mmetsp:Transcript_7322/g.16032  ORF Transcript_7322/g.16032 Transcript_7322/m.16032 type:complete len:233 (-) Transcript_7322:573-1271(-)
MAVQNPSQRRAVEVRADGQPADLGPVRQPPGRPQPDALEPHGGPVRRFGRLCAGAQAHVRRWGSRDEGGREHLPLRPQRLHAAEGLPQLRRRLPDRAGDGGAVYKDGDGVDDGGSARDRSGAQRRQVQRGAAGGDGGGRLPRLRDGDIPGPLRAARPRAHWCQWTGQSARLPGSGGLFRGRGGGAPAGEQVPKLALPSHAAALALRCGGLARQLLPLQVRLAQLQLHELRQL